MRDFAAATTSEGMMSNGHDHDARWKHDGVRVVPGSNLDRNTA